MIIYGAKDKNIVGSFHFFNFYSHGFRGNEYDNNNY